MHFQTHLIYIEINSEILEILIPVFFGLAFILLMYFGIKTSQRNNLESAGSQDSQLPVYLFRAHISKFIVNTKHTYNEIKDMYIKYLKKFALIYSIDETYELNQLQYLISNKVNVEKTIEKGKNETHKKRLLILIFLFNISVRTRTLSEEDMIYIDNVYIDLNLSFSIYSNIKSKYIKDEQKYEKQNSRKSVFSSYKIKRAYKTLNLPDSSNLIEVKKAYRKLAKKYHPDVYKNHEIKSKEYAENSFNKIADAYNTIKKSI